jgi:thymidylate synthase
MIHKIQQLIGSTGEKGWPVAVRDRISFPHLKESRVTDASCAVTFLWTIRDDIIPALDKENLALAANFYTPSGVTGMLRNLLANPHIRYIIMLGEEYSSKSEGDKISEMTSSNALRAFFEKGIDDKRQVPGFETAVHFDNNIPTEMINQVRENVQLIDLNKEMPTAPLPEKIAKVNELMKTLGKKPPFLDTPQVFEYEKSKESFPYEGGPVVVHGSTIPDSWIKMIYNIYRYGRKNLMNADTDRWVKEINNMIVVIHDPQNEDLTVNPFLVPLTIEKIRAYQEEIKSSILPEGKAYTYGNKLRAYSYPAAEEIKKLVSSDEYKDFEFGKGPHLDQNVNYSDKGVELDQVKDLIEVLKRDPYSKACVAVTWHVQDELMRKHKSSPCLVFLQALVQDEKLNLTIFFRSHDMTQGWPENAYGCSALQKEIADGIGYPSGILTIMSGSAQIYNHYYQQVEDMLGKYWKKEVDYNDPRGNFVITIDTEEIKVRLLHPENNAELEVFTGKTAAELMDKITLSSTIINSRHAIYLGAEVQKAEIALKESRSYEQDHSL